MIERLFRVFAYGWLLIAGFNQAKAQNTTTLFIENKGQWAESVKFAAEIPGGMVYVENTTLTYSFDDPQQIVSSTPHSHMKFDSPTNKPINKYAIKIEFLAANQTPDFHPSAMSTTRSNYFFGSNEANWITGVKGYKKLLIKNLYDGIDLEISSHAHHLKYDLKLAPGTNPACVQMFYDGATSLTIDNKSLQIGTPFQTMTERIPASYAFCDDVTRDLTTHYRLQGDVVSFEVGPVDKDESLVLDPLLVFSTYSGSVADNWGNTATFDDAGNGYAGGMTNAFRGGQYLGEFPATSGAYQTQSGGGWDVAILKYDSAGHNLLYATYLGGSGTEVPQSLLVNKEGELLILGLTGSADFPVTANAFDTTFNGGTNYQLLGGVNFSQGSDLFVAKLSADGSQLLASTYLGGTANDGYLPDADMLARNYGDESRGDINFNTNGDIIIASRTESVDFPMSHGYDITYSGGSTDGLVANLSSDLSKLNWSTYLGGSGSDVVLSLKLDRQDNIFVAGGTTSNDFPTTSGVYKPLYAGNADGWVAHLYATGDSLIASSYIGTTEYDQVFFMDLDANEDVFVSGQTTGNYLHTSGTYNSGHTGQFIHKLDNNLTTTRFSTTVNPPGRTIPAISLTAFLVNECDNIYLSGWGSPNAAFTNGYANNFTLGTMGLPVTQDAYQRNTDGSSFYLMVLSGDASELLYATHLGDSRSLVHVDGGTSRFDKHGIVYHSVCASCFGDSSFPTTEGAYSMVNGSSGCNNALFKFDLASLRARIQTNNLTLDDPGLKGGCLPLDVVFENQSTGGEIYEWDFGDGSVISVASTDTIVHHYTSIGTFQVKLRAFDPNTCISEDFAYTSIIVSDPGFSMGTNSDICSGSSAQLTATGGTTYSWSPVVGLSNPSLANPVASPSDTTTYKVHIINNSGCDYEDSVTVNVIPEIIPDVIIEQSNLCQGQREIYVINNSLNVSNVSWSLGDGTIMDEWAPSHTYTKDGQYQIIGTMQHYQCTKEFIENIDIQKLNVPNVITRNEDGFNDVLKITSVEPVNLKIYTRWGTLVYQQQNYQNDWQGKGLHTGIYYYEVKLKSNEVCSGWIQLIDGN